MIDRYTRPEMGRIWCDQARFERWLRIEIAVLEVLVEDGEVPAQALAVIRERAAVDTADIHEIEKTTHHDVIAFVTSVARSVGAEGRHIHRGLTSSDVVDSAQALALLEGLDQLAEGLGQAADQLVPLARTHAHTLMVGRTHGVHAEPTTLGLKLALWYQELRRHVQRLAQLRPRLAVGKLSGAVGTCSGLSPDQERRALERLGLEASPVASQVIQRDRHAEVVQLLALIAASLEKFAVEVRHLARTEVREVEEPFRKGQKGSSAMPHKKNPILCERITGLARVVRGHSLTALENVALWHERDISHSSAERVILPDAFILVDYMVSLFQEVMAGLRVFPERMKANLNASGGLVWSGQVLSALVAAGWSREKAYEAVQVHALAVWEEGTPDLPTRLAGDEAIRQALGQGGLAACFDPSRVLRHADTLLERALPSA